MLSSRAASPILTALLAVCACDTADRRGLPPGGNALDIGSSPHIPVRDAGLPTDRGVIEGPVGSHRPMDASVSDANRPGLSDARILDATGPRDVGVAPDCLFGPSKACMCDDGSFGTSACANATYGACTCTEPAPPPQGTEREILGFLRDGIIGRWQGEKFDQWDPVSVVNFEFRQDGTFAANCFNGVRFCSALYWGFDDDPRRPYAIFDVRADLAGEGEIGLEFRNDIQLAPMESIYLTPDRQFLRFRVWRNNARSHGPVQYVLRRMGP